MMKRWTPWMVFGMIALLLLPGAAQADWLAKMTPKLGLSDTQVKKIRAIMYSGQREMIKLRAEIQIARLDLRELTSQHRPDINKVSAAIDKLGQLELRNKKQRILNMVRMKAVLSAKQAKQLQAIHAKRRKRFRGMRGRRGRHWRRFGGMGGRGMGRRGMGGDPSMTKAPPKSR